MFDLKRFRKENGKITQTEIAKMFNCTQGNIYAIEASGRDLTNEQLDILKSKFGEETTNKYIINLIPNNESPITLKEGVQGFFDKREEGLISIIESQQRTIESLTRTIEALSNSLGVK